MKAGGATGAGLWRAKTNKGEGLKPFCLRETRSKGILKAVKTSYLTNPRKIRR